MKLSKIQLAVLSLIIANIIWGAASPIFKWSLENIQPFTLAFLRFSIAAAIIYPFARNNLKIKKEDIPLLLFISIIGLSFHIGYYFLGLKLSSSINAPIIASAAPIFLIIGASFFLHENLKKKTLQGTAISLAGVLIIIMRPLFENGTDNSVLGNILFIIAMGLSVFYTLLLKELSPKYPATTLTFWMFILASASFLPFVMLESNSNAFLIIFDVKSIIGIAFGAIFSSTIAYNLHTFAIKYISSNEVATFSYVDPVIAIILGNILLGEQLTATFLLGAALIFSGIFISEGRLHYHPIHLLRYKNQPQFINQNNSNSS